MALERCVLGLGGRRRCGSGSVVGWPPQAARSSSTGSHLRMRATVRGLGVRRAGGSVARMSELHDLTALEQGAAIRAGEVSRPPSWSSTTSTRIDRLAEELGAFVTVTADAGAVPAQRPTGDGPLAGVPTAIKDLNATKGVRTSFGSPVFADFVPDFDDEVVQRIAAAGLVSLGKTSTPEFGSPCYTEPEGAPPAVTPWDTTPDGGRLERRVGVGRLRRDWCRWRRAPTVAARSGSRRAAAASSG